MSNSAVNKDSNLSIIAEEIQNRVPAKAIILTGSRATGQCVSESSDYDIVVVMHIVEIPIYLHKLKRLEEELERATGKPVTIRPIPTFKLLRSTGNLYLFKVKSEGLTIYGKDFLPDLEPGDIKDIIFDKYFSYIFSAMKLLINNFHPELLRDTLTPKIANKILNDASKSIIYCGEIYSFLNGFYEPSTQKMIGRLSKIRASQDINKDLIRNLKIALCIRQGTPIEKEPLQLWLEARQHVFDTFRFLFNREMNSESHKLEDLIDQYLNNRRKYSTKNLQYVVLSALDKKGLWLKAAITRYQIEDRLRIALFRLLTSVDNDGSIDKNILDIAYKKELHGYTNIKWTREESELWGNIRDTINTSWPYGCVLMGI